MTEVTTTILNKLGIHARPASEFVHAATKFKSTVQIEAKGIVHDGKSILGVMSLGLSKGTQIKLIADGPDEVEALAKLKEMIDTKFYGEEE